MVDGEAALRGVGFVVHAVQGGTTEVDVEGGLRVEPATAQKLGQLRVKVSDVYSIFEKFCCNYACCS